MSAARRPTAHTTVAPADSAKACGGILVIGVGNRYRQDDGAGPAVVAELNGRRGQDVRTAEIEGDAAALLEAWRGADLAMVVDATCSGAAPGTVVRIVPTDPGAVLPTSAAASTHGMGVVHAVELARALGQLPARLVVYGIEGEAFGYGEGLSPAVERAVIEAVSRICQELGGPTRL